MKEFLLTYRQESPGSWKTISQRYASKVHRGDENILLCASEEAAEAEARSAADEINAGATGRPPTVANSDARVYVREVSEWEEA